MIRNKEILDVKSLSAGYGENIILHDVSFSLQEGEVLVIVGQNGSGKSTLINSLCGLGPKKTGEIFFNKKELNGVAPNKLISLGISYFVQDGLIMPGLTTEEHLQLASINNRGNKRKINFRDVYDFFPKLQELKYTKAGNLSGGERQMLSFGILIMQKTKTWFLDEPTAGLAPSVVNFTVEFLQRKNNEEGITMLIIEHNMDVAFQIASHIAITRNETLTKKYSKQEFLQKDFLNKIVYN